MKVKITTYQGEEEWKKWAELDQVLLKVSSKETKHNASQSTR